MAIHHIDGGCVISARGVWRPGFYSDEKVARAALRFSDVQLQELQDMANIRNGGTGGIITIEDLKGLSK